MQIRLIQSDELAGLLRLYRFLNPGDPVVSPDDPLAQRQFAQVVSDPTLRYFVVECDGMLVATCTLTVIPNFSRGLKPYGVIENVVTDPNYRRRGLATAVLRAALGEAWSRGCYKVMLSTGSKRETTFRFYEQAGFLRGLKTGFVAYPNGSGPVSGAGGSTDAHKAHENERG